MSTTINHTRAHLKVVTGHGPLNARGTGMYPFIVSHYNSDCRALVLQASKRQRKLPHRVQTVLLKLRQQRSFHPFLFLQTNRPHWIRRRAKIRPKRDIPKLHVYIIISRMPSIHSVCIWTIQGKKQLHSRLFFAMQRPVLVFR
jgi:hypothetical protein